MPVVRRDMDPRIELIERMRIQVRQDAIDQHRDLDKRKDAKLEWLDMEELRVVKMTLTGGIPTMTIEEGPGGPTMRDGRTGEVILPEKKAEEKPQE